MPTVRDAAFAVFEHFGVDRLFGNPGSTELPMLKGLPFPYVMGLNEAVVVGMADGFARSARKPALVNLHSAAGTGHSLGNLFTAWKNNAPVVVTAGQQARSILPYDPFLYAERPTEFPRPYVKFSVEPARAEDVPQALIRAFVTALTPPMGPVFVSIPVDDWDRECEMPALPDLDSASRSPRRRESSALPRCIDAARESGAGVRHRGRQCRRLVARHSPRRDAAGRACGPRPTTRARRFPRTTRSSPASCPPGATRSATCSIRFDAILVVGAPVFTYHVEGGGPHWPEHARLMALSDDPQHLADAARRRRRAGRRRRTGSRSSRDVVKQREFTGTQHELMTAGTGNDRRLCPQPRRRTAAQGRGHRRGGPDRARARARRPADHPRGRLLFLRQRRPGLFAARRDRRGDGTGRTRSSRSSATGRRCTPSRACSPRQLEDANVSFLILNNSAYAALTGFSGEFGMNHVPGCDLTGLDFVKLAKGHGVAARSGSRRSKTSMRALEWSFAAKGPTLLDIRIA